MKYLIIILILFASCQKLRYGNVIEKQFVAAHTNMILMPIYTGKTTILIPEWFHYDDEYILTVHGVSTKGKEITKDVYVNKIMFDTTNVGAFLCVDGLCSSDTTKIKVK